MTHSFLLSSLVGHMGFSGISMLVPFFMQYPPERFVETMKLMEHRYGAKDFVTSKDISLLSPGTYYLTEVDTMYRRFYTKKAGDTTTGAPCKNGAVVNGH